MSTKKTLLVIDWSNLMFRSLALNALYGTTGIGTNYDNMDEMKSFIYKFATDVCSLLNIFKANKVIIATDAAHAWRKDIDLGTSVGYKGTRNRDNGYNWENIFKCARDLQSYFNALGYHGAHIEHGEADDIAALCKDVVFKRYADYNVIIVSADADLRQLIDFNPVTNQYCCVYNTIGKGKGGKRYLYATQAFQDWLDKEEDNKDIFFFSYDANRQYIKSLLKMNSNIEVAIEDPNDIVINKIFCGDDGDAVPAFYSWYVNGKCFRVTPVKVKKICETLGIKNVQNIVDVSKTGALKPVLEKVCKREINDIEITERLDRQRHLVELNPSLFPEHISEYEADIMMMMDTATTYSYPVKADHVLSGTEYAGMSKKKAVEASIFKDMDKYLGAAKNNALF